MHYVFLHKKKINEDLIQYTYHFNENSLSPAYLLLTKLFRQMLGSVEDSLDSLEVEYIDIQLAKTFGVSGAAGLLERLGATKDNIRENMAGERVLSRVFRTPLKDEALDYFRNIKDLEELSAYRFFSGNQLKLEVFFVKRMTVLLSSLEEHQFLERLERENIRTKIMG